MDLVRAEIRLGGGWKQSRRRRGHLDGLAQLDRLGPGEVAGPWPRVGGALEDPKAQRSVHGLPYGWTYEGDVWVGQGVGLAGEVLLGRSRARAALRPRQLLAYVWVERLGWPASELARVVGQTRGNVSLAAKRGAEVARAWREQIPGWCR